MTFQKLKSIVKSKLPCPNLRPPASTPAPFHDNSLDKESVTPSHIRSHRTGEALSPQEGFFNYYVVHRPQPRKSFTCFGKPAVVISVLTELSQINE